jgi:hypothetical protein
MDYCGFLVILIVLLINILIVNYIRKLEQVTCECSEEWKRDYIKIYSLITIMITSLICLVPLFFHLINIKYNIVDILSNKLFTYFGYLYTLFGLVNVYALFTYSQRIVLNKCDCSSSWERTFIYYYSMLVMSLYIFLASLLMIGILCCGKLNMDIEFIKTIKNKIKK